MKKSQHFKCFYFSLFRVQCQGEHEHQEDLRGSDRDGEEEVRPEVRAGG